MRGKSLGRHLRLLQLLESRSSGLDVEELMEELGTGRRTLYRDLELLQENGYPLLAERVGRRARWRIDPDFRHRLKLSLTWSEVLALSTGAELLKGLSGTLFHEGAVSALEKIRAMLPRGLAQRVRASEAGVSGAAGGHDYQARAEALERLVEAISGRETIVARYRSRSRGGRAEERRLDPYHLRVVDGGIYVIAWCHRAKAIRTFLLDRFDSVALTEDSFEVSEEFRADRFLAHSFGMWSSGEPVKVRFVASAEIAGLFFEKKIHPTQAAQRRADGSVEVKLEVAMGPPLVAYLAGLGAEVREIQPRMLRDAVVRVHRDALESLEAAGVANAGEASSGRRRPRAEAARRMRQGFR